MSDKITLSAAALTNLETWLPYDLTPDQLEKVMQAAESMATQVWTEATNATRTRDRMRREVSERERAAVAERENAAPAGES